jgi:hypothetical protein
MGGGELQGRAFGHASVSAGLATSVRVEPREARRATLLQVLGVCSDEVQRGG